MKFLLSLLPFFLLCVIVFFYVGQTSIYFNPFKITLERPYFATLIVIATISITFGICLVGVAYRSEGSKQGFREGYDSGVRDCNSIFEELRNPHDTL